MKTCIKDIKKTLIKVMFLKEKVHWMRMNVLWNEISGTGEKLISFPFFVLILSFFHFAFALMHFMFESTFYLFNNKRFKVNIVSLYEKSFKQSLELKSQLKKS